MLKIFFQDKIKKNKKKGSTPTSKGRGRLPPKGEMEDRASRRPDAHNKREREHGYSENTITCGRGGLMLVKRPDAYDYKSINVRLKNEEESGGHPTTQRKREGRDRKRATREKRPDAQNCFSKN